MTLTRLVCVAAPVGEPVSTNEAKLHLRVTQTVEDSLIDRLVQASREFVEAYTGRACLTQTWTAYFDGFPVDTTPIQIPKPPLVAVTSAAYLDASGVLQTWDVARYHVDGATDVTAGGVVHPQAQAGALWPVAGSSYPATQASRDAVRVTFTCGYGPTALDVPAMLTAALKIKLADLFMLGRESRAPMTVMYDRNAIENLLGPFVIFDKWAPDTRAYPSSWDLTYAAR